MRAVVQLTLKDLRLLWHDRLGLFWILGFPLTVALFFGATSSSERGDKVGTMQIVIADEDGTPESKAFIKRLEKSGALKIEQMDVASAREKVLRGQRSAFVRIPKGYANVILFSPEAPAVEVGIDPSRKAEAGYLQGLLTQAAFERMRDPKAMRENLRHGASGIELSDLEINKKERLKKFLLDLEGVLGSMEWGESEMAQMGEPVPIQITEVRQESVTPRTSWELVFPSSVLWAILGCAAGFAIGLVIERKEGTLLRLHVAPISRAQILAGKALACFLACTTVSILLLVFGSLVFGVRIASIGLLVLGVVATAVCFVGVMMLLSVIGRTEQSVAGAGWAILLVMAMLGGGMIPLFAMPSWMQTVSHLSPVKWGILALEGAIWRGFRLQEMFVPCSILVGVGVAFFSAGVWVFMRRET